MKKSLAILTAITLFSSIASAQNPINCTVMPADAMQGLVFSPFLPTPAPASINTITVRNSVNAPMSNVVVSVMVGAPISVCGASILSGLTNAAGQVVLTLGGGGCLHNSANAGVVVANGVTIRNYSNVKSPDFDGGGGNRQVSLADYVQFAAEFGGSIPSACHDYDNSSLTGLSDLIIFTAAFVSAASCAP